MLERVRNPIVRVHWAGWESDTLALQQAGWEISMDQDPHRGRLRLALRHRQHQIYGVSRTMNDFISPYAGGGSYLQERSWKDYPVIVFDRLASELIFHIQTIPGLSGGYRDGPDGMGRFQPVDAEPMFTSEEIKNLDDFKIFRPLDAIEEVVIAPANVTEMLAEIIKFQEPQQAAIREKKRKDFRKLYRELMVGGATPGIANPEKLIAQVISIS